jgi:hypothetical protein
VENSIDNVIYCVVARFADRFKDGWLACLVTGGQYGSEFTIDIVAFLLLIFTIGLL